MNFVGYLACFLSILLNSYVLFWCYSKIDTRREVSRLRVLLSIFVGSILVFVVNMFITTYIKFILIYLIMCFMFYCNFNNQNKISTLLIKTLGIYILMTTSDVFSSIILMQFDLSSLMDKINYLKALGTLLNSISMIILFNLNKLVGCFKTVVTLIIGSKNNLVLFFGLLTLTTIWIIDCFHQDNASVSTFILAVTILIFLSLLIAILIYQYFKRKTAEDEKQQLQELMHEYENVLNQTSENRHEMLNDLLILRSIADKNSSEFTRTLDGIIRQYDTKKFKKYTSLAKLPTGVKGMIYYKIAFINENEINFDTVVNGVDYAKFEAMDKELYYKVCKILGILMDNAIDACVDSDKKKLVVSVYTENEDLCVEIDNSYSGVVDTDGIKKKGYTTKGKNHGYGLTILNRIVDETKELEFEQSINDKDKLFTSILKIKL